MKKKPLLITLFVLVVGVIVALWFVPPDWRLAKACSENGGNWISEKGTCERAGIVPALQ